VTIANRHQRLQIFGISQGAGIWKAELQIPYQIADGWPIWGSRSLTPTTDSNRVSFNSKSFKFFILATKQQLLFQLFTTHIMYSLLKYFYSNEKCWGSK